MDGFERTLLEGTPGQHWVRFYDAQSELTRPLSAYVVAALERGEGSLVIADAEHRAAVRSEVGMDRWDLALEHGSLIALDSREVVEAFSRGGALDENLFRQLVCKAIQSVGQASEAGRVRAFGEAVAVFSRRGDFESACELERFWNRLMSGRDLCLLCAYPYSHFPTLDHAGALEAVCHAHTHVDPGAHPAVWEHRHTRSIDYPLSEQRARARRQRAEELDAANVTPRLLEGVEREGLALIGAGVGHDLNNVLTVIDSASEYLLDIGLVGEPRAAVQGILEATERAHALIRQLLAMGGKRTSLPRRLSANVVVGQLFPVLRRILGKKIELLAEFDANLGEILADQNQLDHVLLHLVSNARDAVLDTENAHVFIRTRRVDATLEGFDLRPGAYTLVQISDNGRGIAPELQRKVFEPFFTTKASGSGVGLTTVGMLMRKNRGSVWLQSKPAGGTTVYLAFPELSNNVTCYH